MERPFDPTIECVPDHPLKGMWKSLNYTQIVAIEGTRIGHFGKKFDNLRACPHDCLGSFGGLRAYRSVLLSCMGHTPVMRVVAHSRKTLPLIGPNMALTV